MRKLLFLMIGFTLTAAATPVSFTLTNPALTGQAGQTVGWGFIMTVDPGFVATVTGSNYVMDQDLGSQVGYSRGGDPGGIFENDGPDIIGYNGGPVDFLLDSSAPWTQSFLWIGNPGSTGVRAFRICSAADPACGFTPAVGSTEYGFLSIDYQYGDGETWTADSFTNVPVSVTVEASTESAAVPEPGTIVLATSALLALVLIRVNSRSFAARH